LNPSRIVTDPDLIALRFHQLPAALLGHLLGAMAVVVLFYGDVDGQRLAGWLLAFFAVWMGRALLGQSWKQALPEAPVGHWILRWNVGVLASGALWGCAVLLFYGAGGTLERVGLVLLVLAYCVGAPSASYRVFGLHATLCFTPLLMQLVLDPDPNVSMLAGVLALAFITTMAIGRNNQEALDRILRLKRALHMTAAQLIHEKTVAEAAQRRAEAASQARSQFFSAASHDLRQPLHALILLAGEIRLRNQAPGLTPLVDDLGQAVEVLDTMFGQLLDLSRLDGERIEVRIQSVPLRPLLERVRVHFAPLAFDQGLDLHLHVARVLGAEVTVRADPVLLERMVRNLLSNALRYTLDGGVLVSVRPRNDEICLQVWDTGLGIAPERQAEIFDEFCQVAEAQQHVPPQRRGLGLGLAITRRLAELTGVRISLRSRPERGSVFCLHLSPADSLPHTPVESLALHR
jgi:signal transduction histidine kinase